MTEQSEASTITQMIEPLQALINESGEPCDFGLSIDNQTDAIDQAKRISSKPYCLVSNWMWWDLECTPKVADMVREHGFEPSIIYSHHVIVDEKMRFPTGGFARSTLLQSFTRNAFFETQNTMYVLMGKGTRKTVKREHALSIG